MYEVTPWRTVGGLNGQYELESPWDTPCEIILVQVSANGLGRVILSFDSNEDFAAIQSAFAGGIPTPGARCMVLRCQVGIQNFAPDPVPMGPGVRRMYVFIQTDAGGNAVYVTAHFRRPAPEPGSYDHSRQTLEATYDLTGTGKEYKEQAEQWSKNLTEEHSGLRQSYRPYHSELRRSNSSKKRGLHEKMRER